MTNIMGDANGLDNTNKQFQDIMTMLSDVHSMHQDTQKTMDTIGNHLSNIASSNNAICNLLGDVKDKMLNTVLGKDIVPLGVTQSLLEQQRNSYNSIIKFMLIACGGLVTLLIGIKYLAPGWFS